MKIIAHRGYWKAEGAAQNSINSIKAALDEKFDGIEVDIRMSKDGLLYLNHDDSIEGYVIHETHSSVLDQLKLSSGENITHFEDFIELVKERTDFTLFLEIKTEKSWEYRRLILRKLIDLLRSKDLIKNSVLLCFDVRILRRSLFIEPKLSRMLLREHLNIKFYKIILNRVNAIGLYYPLLLEHPELLEKCQKLGLKINAWTVNEIEEAEQMLNLPITSITSDIPNELLKLRK